jgi:hypothetical protein
MAQVVAINSFSHGTCFSGTIMSLVSLLTCLLVVVGQVTASTTIDVLVNSAISYSLRWEKSRLIQPVRYGYTTLAMVADSDNHVIVALPAMGLCLQGRRYPVIGLLSVESLPRNEGSLQCISRHLDHLVKYSRFEQSIRVLRIEPNEKQQPGDLMYFSKAAHSQLAAISERKSSCLKIACYRMEDPIRMVGTCSGSVQSSPIFLFSRSERTEQFDLIKTWSGGLKDHQLYLSQIQKCFYSPVD